MNHLPIHARDLRRIADYMDSLADPQHDERMQWPHPESADLLARKHTDVEQLSYVSPLALRLRDRIARAQTDLGKIGHGVLVASVLDAALRDLGYPPPSDEVADAVANKPPRS